jgi:hypothetical protein
MMRLCWLGTASFARFCVQRPGSDRVRYRAVSVPLDRIMLPLAVRSVTIPPACLLRNLLPPHAHSTTSRAPASGLASQKNIAAPFTCERHLRIEKTTHERFLFRAVSDRLRAAFLRLEWPVEGLLPD